MTTPVNTVRLNSLCNEVLTLIEADEASILNWGFLEPRSDLGATLPQLLKRLPPAAQALWEEEQALGTTPRDLLANLIDRKLLFESGDLYRTRFAETIRLLYLLRQRFTHDDWQTAKRLVSDLKVQLVRRRYPRRDVVPETVLERLKDLGVNDLRRAVIKRLTTDEEGQPLRLAEFQVEAILQQVRNLQQSRDRALVIGAGTGAGKTKAFYIPALAEVAATLSGAHRVRAIAIYPRIELLKDQLAEAFSEARKIDTLLAEHNLRRIAIGAYYGDIPESARDFLHFPPESWQPTADKVGWACPFFFCPSCTGDRNLVWSREDLAQEAELNARGEYGQFERLRCPNCGFEASGSELRLTRNHLFHAPPDFLFTTTEMLNRRLSRAGEHALFGIGVSPPPRLVLLDEIHTYEDLHGAQVAYLLRRWRHARGSTAKHSLCMVGLSATLSQAETFFAKLTGLPPHCVTYVTPREEDLIEEGVEYNVVLKGDPVSGTNLLSTSVQTVMLLGRILDPSPVEASGGEDSVSGGAYGRRIFAFTDKLDVINRWYHIEQDAETDKQLSRYRDPPRGLTASQRQKRNGMGQDWAMCQHIGHDLLQPLRLGLTSSQYRGVRATADLVIATSTLEVGFNDPTVGAVVQHKAPRSMASFLQRKGRAGRTRQMRPWMVVVTSAYGRDRWAFQHAEDLFQPVLPPIELPLNNAYVRKIQATYALMDWLAFTLKKRGVTADLWSALSSSDRGKKDRRQEQRGYLRSLLLEILTGEALDDLSTYIRSALGIVDDERDLILSELLWHEPRSLLYHVIPTLLRQVESEWQRVEKGQTRPWSDHISPNPMPDFVPPSLFTDLDLPELVLRIPALPRETAGTSPRAPQSGYRRLQAAQAAAQPVDGAQPVMSATRKEEAMALAAGMTEFAPGHVSKRFARRDAPSEAHWLALPDEAQLSRGKLPLQYLKIDRDELPQVVNVDGQEYRVFRPRAYALDQVPKDVTNSSSARLLWRSHFAPQNHRHAAATTVWQSDDLGDGVALSSTSPWRSTFRRICSYTQANGCWLEATRLAIGVRVETRFTDGQERRRTLLLEEGAEERTAPAALGFTSSVDALRFTFEPLSVERLLATPTWADLYRHLGPEYFLERLRTDHRLLELGLSTFEIGWLWQLELSMLVATAVARQCSLAEAAAEIANNRQAIADRTMRVIFQSQRAEDEDEKELVGRLHQKLLEYSARAEVQDALRDCAAVLWQPDQSGLTSWLQRCYASSLGAATFAAVTRLVPDIDPDELILDVDGQDIWISEAAAGGVGLISRITDVIAQHPRSFDLQLRDILHHCDREQLAIQLRSVAGLVREPDLQQAFARVRQSGDLPQQQETRRVLASVLEGFGIPATREVVVALNAKYLRPNSGTDSDELLASLVRHWKEEEERIGCAIDLRVMAVAAPKIPDLDAMIQQVLHRIGAGDAPADENQVFNVLQSMLWLSCSDSCPDCIERGHPYQELVRPSRALLLALLEADLQPLRFGAVDWEEHCREQLTSSYRSRVACRQEELQQCSEVLHHFLAAGVEIGYQHLYPVLERVERTGRDWVSELVVSELVGD